MDFKVTFMMVLFLTVNGQWTRDKENIQCKIGVLSTIDHGVKGEVHSIDNTRLIIKNFKYDGQADAFFWVGKGKEPDSQGTVIPHPEGTSGNSKLPGFNGVDTKITLTEGNHLSDGIGYLSIWSKDKGTNLGHVVIPDSFKDRDHTTECIKSSAHPNSASIVFAIIFLTAYLFFT